MTINTDGLADVADLVGEAYLERMPDIVGVLDHLGGFHRGANQRRIEMRIDTRQHVASCESVSPITVLGGL